MPQASKLTAVGFSAGQAKHIGGTVQGSLTAAGTTQGTAFSQSADVMQFTTVGSGTGVILNPMNAGDSAVIQNDTATNALLIYPPVGGQINALGTNAGYSLATTATANVYCVNANQYICTSST